MGVLRNGLGSVQLLHSYGLTISLNANVSIVYLTSNQMHCSLVMVLLLHLFFPGTNAKHLNCLTRPRRHARTDQHQTVTTFQTPLFNTLFVPETVLV